MWASTILLEFIMIVAHNFFNPLKVKRGTIYVRTYFASWSVFCFCALSGSTIFFWQSFVINSFHISIKGVLILCFIIDPYIFIIRFISSFVTLSLLGMAADLLSTSISNVSSLRLFVSSVRFHFRRVVTS